MSDRADLEIILYRRDNERYGVELRYSQPGSDTDIRLLQRLDLSVQFDVIGLRQRLLDDAAYGRLLSENLFNQSDIKNVFAMAYSSARAADVPLQLRLLISPDASNLHDFRWETLRNPLLTDRTLATDEVIWFSRYVSSRDWRPVQLRTKEELRALVVVANPANLATYKLEAINVDKELDSIQRAFGETIPFTALASGGNATTERILAELRQGYDILYIVAHGSMFEGAAVLWLEDEAGMAARISGDVLVKRLSELQERPRLIVFASCQSAGGNVSATGQNPFVTVGPNLAKDGIPAVLAMQGNVSITTIEKFMPVFFTEVCRHGQIDRAVAVARSQVQNRPDWWMPVLFMRLKSGRIGWYDPGFTEDESLKKWPALLASIRDQECTPILGLGLAESMFGSRRQLASQWAEEHGFPMAPHEREGLPQVSRYLTVYQDARFPRRSLILYFCNEIRARHADLISKESRTLNLERLSREELLQLFNQLVSEIWAKQQYKLNQAFHVLAALDLPIYLTADPSDLLVNALRDLNKEPRIELCPWNVYTERLLTRSKVDHRYIPSPEEPLVYYLFGRLAEPDSLVLTEDEYFDYLIGTTRYRDLISDEVRQALANTTLLFLGFRFDDWDFRVFYRVLMSQEGRPRYNAPAHVAAQIAPDEASTVLPQRAKEYLEEYFRGASIHIYWGKAKDFVQELQRRLRGEA